MAKLTIRSIEETLLSLENPDVGLYTNNHIYEPEFHQEEYVSICKDLEQTQGAYQLSGCESLVTKIHRGIQPKYADTDVDSPYWQGMTKNDGSIVDDKLANVCALKSICVRAGYVDLETARSVSQGFYEKNKNRAGILKNDVLINSTGDGTIGRVCVFNHDFPAVVDGHITILRFADPNLAWFIGAYLMSDSGQKQITRYINGSSGQVEIYPQDIARIWIKPATDVHIANIANNLKSACEKYSEFKQEIKKAMSAV